jgi:hypothetical protein
MFKFLLQLNEELYMERWNLGFTRIREENNPYKVDKLYNELIKGLFIFIESATFLFKIVFPFSASLKAAY